MTITAIGYFPGKGLGGEWGDNYAPYKIYAVESITPCENWKGVCLVMKKNGTGTYVKAEDILEIKDGRK